MSNTNHNLQKEIWITSKWRPATAWMYMVVCIFDFIIFPIMWSIVQIIFNGKVDSPWTPITLIGAGLFHMAMGAIVKKPAVLETPDGDVIAIRHKMFLSHSYDHRVVDGALGGMFVRRVADYLEQWDVNREI